MKFNVNNPVKVKLTTFGMEEMKRQHAEIQAVFPAAGDFTPLHQDSEGYVSIQLWKLMEVFGPLLHNGCPLPFETEILIGGEV